MQMQHNSVSFIHLKVLIIAAVMACTLSMVNNLQAAEDMPFPRILVNGEGRVDIAPDMAILSLTVAREAETAQQALKAGSAAMNDVLDAMLAEGIEKRDLQTSRFSIQPRYVRPAPKTSGEVTAPQIVGYTVRNSLTVRVRDIDAVGRILDKSVSLGVNEGGNISFTNDEPSAAITSARIKAVQDAASKAQTLAETAGVKVGRILEISEQSYYPSPQPVAMSRMQLSVGAASDAVPVVAGENSYSVTVNVNYAIDQ
jgi:uncharacterized protein YggE